jgi:prevent-host-death family protein
MHTIGAFEAKTHFSSLLAQVEQGEQVIITKHGHPVAKLVPATGMNRERVLLAIKKLKEFSSTNTLGDVEWKTLRDEGRR